MPHLPAHVANAFLYRAQQDGITDVTPLKIQKLVYCMHGWHLATRNAPAVGELFEAWPYGPVLSALYHEFKQYGRSRIDGYASEVDPASGEYRTLMVTPEDKEFYEVFNPVWNRYKNMSGITLIGFNARTGYAVDYCARKGRFLFVQ